MRLIFIKIIILSCFMFFGCKKSATTDTSVDMELLFDIKLSDVEKDSVQRSISSQIGEGLGLSNSKINREKLINLLKALRKTRDSISFDKVAKLSRIYSIQEDDLENLALIHHYTGSYFENNNNYEKAYEYYLKSATLYEELNKPLKFGENEFFQARVLGQIGLMLESEAKIVSAISAIDKNYTNSALYIESLRTLSNFLMLRSDIEKGNKYIEEALQLILNDYGKFDILPKKNADFTLAIIYGERAVFSIGNEKYDEALASLKLALTYIKPYNIPLIYNFLEISRIQAEYKLNFIKILMKKR